MRLRCSLYVAAVIAAAGLCHTGFAADKAAVPEGVKASADTAEARKHADKCAGCSAEAVWKGFLDHLRETGHGDLIPPDALPPEKDEDDEDGDAAADRAARGAFPLSLVSGEPLRVILFKLSPDLVNIDAMFSEAAGEQLPPEKVEKARALAAKLRESKDPYLEPYGVLHGARLDIQAGDCPAAVKALEGLVKSCFFLPRREARRHLARAYSCVGDDTLALLELQFFLLDVPPQDEADALWAKDELKKIRDKKHPGPLHHSEENMRSISGLISGLDVGDPTQAKERRVEDILDKVAKLLEKKGGT